MLLNKSQLKCLGVFSIFAIIGFGPISPGCLIGMYVVLFRPAWFLNLASGLYIGKPIPIAVNLTDQESKRARKKGFFWLSALFILDIAPVPVTPVAAFFIILIRPVWLYRLIFSIYAQPVTLAATSAG